MRLFTVDSFTTTPFAGNPAGVVPLEAPLEDSTMLKIARELNLAETAFFRREGDRYRLRWFTPAVEVKLCGHATLASAHVLWSELGAPQDQPLRFATLSGELICRFVDGMIEMDFPAYQATPSLERSLIAAALGAEPDNVAGFGEKTLAEFSTARKVRELAPDFAAIAKLPTQGIVVTARADDGRYDFVSRFFAPAVGINEDPVTGSAHCALGPYWLTRLGKSELSAYQASARGGEMTVVVRGERVLLRGRAITMLSGDLKAK